MGHKYTNRMSLFKPPAAFSLQRRGIVLLTESGVICPYICIDYPLILREINVKLCSENYG